jgi:seryl-tRNA synthetase
MTTTEHRTTEHMVALASPVPLSHAEELAKRVYFVAEEILGFRVLTNGDTVTGIAVTVAGDRLPDGLAEKLDFVLRNDVAPQLVREPKVVWRREAERDYPADTFDRLVADGVATIAGEGQVALGEPLLSLMDDLDRVVRRIVVDEFGGREYRYPTLIPLAALDRCGYLTSFPQYAMFATRLRSDVDNYRAFLDRMGDDGTPVGERILPHCGGVDYCLPPTMCYHTFHQLTGTELPAGTKVVTARGKSFRHEARYHRGLARLWDFTIREIVFLGTRDEVLDARSRFLARALELADALGVSGRCEVASDPFFANVDSGVRATSQRLLELKYELQLDLAPGDAVSVASFNFHEQFFGDAFELRLPGGDTPFSGCVGFGLERFAFALVCQHGTDPAAWPTAVRAVLAPTQEGTS